MNKQLAASALDDAFRAHVADKFATLCAGSNERGYDKALDVFAADFRFAQRAHAEAVKRLASEDADRPELEDDGAYRARILASIGPSPRNHRAVSVSGAALDTYGVTLGIKRGARKPDGEQENQDPAPERTPAEVKADQEAQARKSEARANDTSGRDDLNRGSGPGGTAQVGEAGSAQVGSHGMPDVEQLSPSQLVAEQERQMAAQEIAGRQQSARDAKSADGVYGA
jgi:hypothetical protein